VEGDHKESAITKAKKWPPTLYHVER